VLRGTAAGTVALLIDQRSEHGGIAVEYEADIDVGVTAQTVLDGSQAGVLEVDTDQDGLTDYVVQPRSVSPLGQSRKSLLLLGLPLACLALLVCLAPAGLLFAVLGLRCRHRGAFTKASN
jgi:hypothetical protein